MSTPFWERLTALCAENDTTPNAVMLKTGLNTGNPTAWRKGRMPGTKAAKAIADYFGVTVDYLLGAEEAKKAPASEETRASDDELKFALFGGGGEITDEMFEEVKAFAQWVKARNSGK